MRRCQVACKLRRLIVASVKISPPIQGNRNDQTAGGRKFVISLPSIAARTGVSARPLTCLNLRMIAREVSLYKHQAQVLSMTGDINQHCPHFPCGRSCCRGLPYCTHFGSDIDSSSDQQLAHRLGETAKARHSTNWWGRINVLRWSSKLSISLAYHNQVKSSSWQNLWFFTCIFQAVGDCADEGQERCTGYESGNSMFI